MLTMRIYFYCQLVVIVAILALIPTTVKADHYSKPAHRKLKSASELDYPPFALVRPDGSADGFSVDLLKAVSQAVGLEVNFSVGPWHEIKQKLEERNLDVLPLVAYAQERDKMFDFTVPYLRMHGTIFVHKKEKSIHSKADLKDKEVMVMRSDAAHEYVVRENLSNKLVLTDSFEEAMKLLSEGKHDAVVVQQLVGLQLIKKLGISNVVNLSTSQETSLKPFDKPLSGFEQKFCFAVQDGDRELLALLNEGLAIVSANGTYEDLYNKWFSPILPQPPIPLTLIFKYLFFILGPILFFIAIVGLWYLKREVGKKKRSETKLRELSSRLLSAHEEERRYIGQELHDGLAQTLTAIKVWVENAHSHMDKKNTAEVTKSFETLVPLAQGAVDDVRRISMNLRPTILDDLGILPTISWLCQNFETIYPSIEIETQIEIQENGVSESLKIIIFRVLQEALNNIAKHSQANIVRIYLKQGESALELTINDNGVGFDAEQISNGERFMKGIGLDSMKERATLSGGSFLIESQKGEGTNIQASWVTNPSINMWT